MELLDKIIREIMKYDEIVLGTYPGAEDSEIDNLESKLGYVLPGNFKEFLRRCNGFLLDGETLYGIHSSMEFSLSDQALDLYRNYIWEKDEVGNPIWPHLLPISPNGFGDHYCLDLKTLTQDKSECRVIFWQHDYNFSEENPPDVDAETFLDFIWRVLMDIKECGKYDGTDK